MKGCVSCQNTARGPTRFRFLLGPVEIQFSERVLIDIMYINGSIVLYIVDEGTHFSAASFLINCSSEEIWKTTLRCWATIYTGLPNCVLVDQVNELCKSSIFASLPANANIQLSSTGTEAHSRLGLNESFHQPLRTNFINLALTYPKNRQETVAGLLS